MKYNALKELILTRTREFYREPEAIFWVYGFPVLLMAGLGVAFRGGGQKEIAVDLVDGPKAELTQKLFDKKEPFRVTIASAEEALRRYTAGKTDLIVDSNGDTLRYTLDTARTGSTEAKIRVNDFLQEARGRQGGAPTEEKLITEPGGRYIDWLIPGIIGMNIMGGGMWGLGFVTVDLRMRKLLKRFVATPMRRSDFLLALMVSRLFFMIPETAAVLAVGHFAFGLQLKGTLAGVGALALIGSIAFSGIGLLVACRADKIETVSGLMNFIMLPMWMLSGIFFAASRFPDLMQPLVQALPLTQLNNALRAVILEGAPVYSQGVPIAILLAYGVVAFAAALKWFKWK